ncbi:MAG TPA: glycosyltransferase [Telluria sp.]|nr:glycosyltransferase [Telluria sp.]
MTEPRFRILQLVPEPLPSFRADVATLFGKYLPRHAVACDIVGKAGQGEAAGQGFLSTRRPARHSRRWRNELSFAWLCIRSALTVPKSECDIIQVRDMVSIGLATLAIARLRGMRFSYWVSFLMSEGRIERARRELARRFSLHYTLVLWKGLAERAILYRIVLARADHVFVQSDAMLERMAARGIPRERMTAVPMGVDTEKLGAAAISPRRLPGWEGAPVLAYLGTLDSSRHLDKVLDTLAILRRRYPGARLLLIGDSPTPSDVARLREYAAGLGLADAIHITGWLAADDALPLLAGADAAISYIPRGELFDISSPTKLLEYLALAVPCVGNDTPDQVRVLSASDAGWLTGSTPDEMAEGVAAIFDNPAAARARAAAGPRFIEENRSYRVLAEQVARRYRALS